MSGNIYKKTFLITLIILIFLSSIGYWLYTQLYISTDNAYINANEVEIAPRVTGQVSHLYIKNNQYVKAGQLLFDLDPATYQIAVEQAKASLLMSTTKLDFSEQTFKRQLVLVQKKVASAQEGDEAKANLQSAIAQVQLDKANLKQAELNLFYTHVVAPTNGWVTNVTLREGNIVNANQSLFALISDNEYWIDANFKETALEEVKINSQADIIVDMYPDHHFKGVVESISGGSGNAFSLLPPENATGNWVKVTQRVPVRIRVIDPDPHFPLRIGTSATVTIWLNS